jgi:hypothetical protein
MAPPRRKRPSPGQYRDYKIRLPEDVAERIEAKAKEKGWPQNRTIINELAEFPNMEPVSKLGEQVRELDVIIAQYGARITWHDLSDDLLKAVDAILKTKLEGAEIDKLRVVRSAMLGLDRTAKR